MYYYHFIYYLTFTVQVVNAPDFYDLYSAINMLFTIHMHSIPSVQHTNEHIRDNVGFSVLPKDTSDLPVGRRLLHQLSHSCSAEGTRGHQLVC